MRGRSYSVEAVCPSCQRTVAIRVCGGTPNGDGLHQARRLAVEMHQRMEGCPPPQEPRTAPPVDGEQLSIFDVGVDA